MGARGAKVKDITAEFDVQIKFPERDTAEAADIPVKNGEEVAAAEPGANDIIRITGRPENCESAKKALLEQVCIHDSYLKLLNVNKPKLYCCHYAPIVCRKSLPH